MPFQKYLMIIIIRIDIKFCWNIFFAYAGKKMLLHDVQELL